MGASRWLEAWAAPSNSGQRCRRRTAGATGSASSCFESSRRRKAAAACLRHGGRCRAPAVRAAAGGGVGRRNGWLSWWRTSPRRAPDPGWPTPPCHRRCRVRGRRNSSPTVPSRMKRGCRRTRRDGRDREPGRAGIEIGAEDAVAGDSAGVTQRDGPADERRCADAEHQPQAEQLAGVGARCRSGRQREAVGERRQRDRVRCDLLRRRPGEGVDGEAGKRQAADLAAACAEGEHSRSGCL